MFNHPSHYQVRPFVLAISEQPDSVGLYFMLHLHHFIWTGQPGSEQGCHALLLPCAYVKLTSNWLNCFHSSAGVRDTSFVHYNSTASVLRVLSHSLHFLMIIFTPAPSGGDIRRLFHWFWSPLCQDLEGCLRSSPARAPNDWYKPAQPIVLNTNNIPLPLETFKTNC